MGKVTDQASQPIVQTKASMKKVQADRDAAARVRGASLKEQKAVVKQAAKSQVKEENKKEEKKKQVVLDAGHGGTKDHGSQFQGLAEEDLNLKATFKVKKILLKNGYEIIMTRSSDVEVHKDQRYNIANKKRADLFVSIHTNSSKPFFHGACIMTPSNHDQSSSVNLANKIRMRMSQAGINMTDNSIYRDHRGIAVLRGTTMPAIIVEMGYICGDAELLNKEEYLNNMAWSIAYGIMDYYATYKKV